MTLCSGKKSQREWQGVKPSKQTRMQVAKNQVQRKTSGLDVFVEFRKERRGSACE